MTCSDPVGIPVTSAINVLVVGAVTVIVMRHDGICDTANVIFGEATAAFSADTKSVIEYVPDRSNGVLTAPLIMN